MDQETQIKRADWEVGDLREMLSQTQYLLGEKKHKKKHSLKDWEGSFEKTIVQHWLLISN